MGEGVDMYKDCADREQLARKRERRRIADEIESVAGVYGDLGLDDIGDTLITVAWSIRNDTFRAALREAGNDE